MENFKEFAEDNIFIETQRSEWEDCNGTSIQICTSDYEVEIGVYSEEEIERYKDFNILSVDSLLDVLRECYESSDDFAEFLYHIKDTFITDHTIVFIEEGYINGELQRFR